jgi:hypothetical protein
LGVWLKERAEKKKATMASQKVDEEQEQAKQGTIAKEEDEARSG